MGPKSTLRDDWDERRRLEAQLLRATPIFESVSELEALYTEFGRYLEEQEPDLQQRRTRYLSELQGRLARAARYHQELRA